LVNKELGKAMVLYSLDFCAVASSTDTLNRKTVALCGRRPFRGPQQRNRIQRPANSETCRDRGPQPGFVFGLKADDHKALPRGNACSEHRDCPSRANDAGVPENQGTHDERSECKLCTKTREPAG